MLEKLLMSPNAVAYPALLGAAIYAFLFEHLVPGTVHRARIKEIQDERTKERADWNDQRQRLEDENERWTQTALRALGHAETIVGQATAREARR